MHSSKRIVNLYRFSTVLFAVLITALSLWYDLPPTSMGILSALLGLCFLLLAAFPVYMGDTRIVLTPLLSFPSGMLLGPGLTMLAVTLGSLLGNLIRITARKPRFTWQQASFEVGISVIPLSVCFALLGLWGNLTPVDWQRYLILGISFAGTLLLVHVIDRIFRQPAQLSEFFSAGAMIFFISILIIPITLVTAQIYLIFGESTLVGLGTVIVIITVVLHRIGITRLMLERRLQELSALNVISKSVSATLDLEGLLEILQKNVTRLLGIDNFFVALTDQKTGELWYPIAIKFGEHKSWPRRPRMARLTDQVIATQQPLLFARDASSAIARIGLPSGEDELYAWMGVPLISSEMTAGCMGVFSISPRVEFTQADLDFLVTISGQVSVAIENALLYENTQRRSKQLEMLNHLSAQVSTSLELPQVLLQVCRGVMRITEAPMASIFLKSSDNQLQIEHAEGFTPDNLRQLEKFFISSWERHAKAEAGIPFLIPDISQEELPDEDRRVLQSDEIRAWSSFPLTTSGDDIGFLQVCYSEPLKPESDLVDLLQAFSAQAALAVTNANLYAATDMALASRVHQLAILETIGRRLLAHFDADQLFEMILNYAIDFTRSPQGFLGIYQSGEENLTIMASRGYSGLKPTLPVDRGITGKALHSQKPVVVQDTSLDSEFEDTTGSQPKSQLSVPLIYEGVVLGVIALESNDPNAFGQDDQSLVLQLANYAALAVNNAQLYGELQRRLREQSTLYVVTSHLVGAIDPENLMQVIGEAIQTAIQPLRTGLYLHDDGTESFALIQCVPADQVQALPLRLELGHLKGLVPISVNVDILKIPPQLISRVPVLRQDEHQKALVVRLSGTGQDLGLALLHLPVDRNLQVNEIQLLQAIIAQGTIALQNALLFADFVQARERLSAILNTIEEGILLVDVRGTIVLANYPIEAHTGLILDQTLDKKLHDLPAPVLKVLGFTSDTAREMVKRLNKGLLIESPQTVIVLTEGKPERVLERSLTPVMSQLGQIIGVMIVLHDKTEEHQIQQAREMITDTLVHDLRSPISAVMSALEILDELLSTDGQEGELISQAMRVAQRSSEKVFNLVTSLLEIARMQSGDIDLTIQPVSLYDLASDVIADYTLQANEFGIILTNEIPPDIPEAMADKNMLERVFVNLLDNALKFTPGGGKVKIDAQVAQQGRITVFIADSGPGIPPEYREKIFDRFSQIPEQASRRRGSGLGLAFCKLVINAHGGEIWVEPNTPFGSVFAISLSSV
jgi:signal transduction histidine kinase/transcriptional regulator with GAF, ATPase, and Fis domain